MGTNFYMMTSDKEAANEWFEDSYELTDYPQWGYSIHIAKTSGGWKPLFQEHNRIHSVNDIKLIMSTGKFSIYDEYGTIYTWNEFVKRLLIGIKMTLRHILTFTQTVQCPIFIKFTVDVILMMTLFRQTVMNFLILGLVKE